MADPSVGDCCCWFHPRSPRSRPLHCTGATEPLYADWDCRSDAGAPCIRLQALGGVDSLYSIVQMPRGVPVATVAIGNAKNAGLLAIRMVAGCGGDAELLRKMVEFQEASRDEVEAKAEKLEAMGVAGYLAEKGAPQSATVM